MFLSNFKTSYWLSSIQVQSTVLFAFERILLFSVIFRVLDVRVIPKQKNYAQAGHQHANSYCMLANVRESNVLISLYILNIHYIRLCV
jgi:organic hydroperoxide reductase OsmC/OhrA